MDLLWATPLGYSTTRVALAERYGGSPFSGGIVPADKSGNLFIFSDPDAGEEFGYIYDGLSVEEDVFYYTGHGPNGDHELAGGNRSVANHVEAGRAIRLFVADGYVAGTKTKNQKYIGEYRIDPDRPFRREPGKGKDGLTRTVLVFRLVPIGHVLHGDLLAIGLTTKSSPESAGALLVPKEVDSVYFFPVQGTQPYSASKRENSLVAAYESFRGVQPIPFQRWAIRVPGESTRLLTDVYESSTRTLFEAKANSERGSIRLAIGQLLDYRRHIPIPDLHSALLLPSRPTNDLLHLIKDAGLGLVYADRDGSFKASSTYIQHLKSLTGLARD